VIKNPYPGINPILPIAFEATIKLFLEIRIPNLIELCVPETLKMNAILLGKNKVVLNKIGYSMVL